MDKETLQSLGIEGDAADKILAAHNASVNGLKAKNDELLGKIAKGKGTDPEEVKRLKKIEADYEALQQKKQEENGEFQKLYGQTKEELKKIQEESAAALQAKDKQINDMKKEMQIGDALGAHNVIPGMREIAVNTILPNVALDDNGKAMVGSKKVSDFVNDWVKGDVGKHFLLNDRSGGGADGSNSTDVNAEQAGWFKKGSPTWNLTKQAQLRKQDPALADKLAKQGANG